MDIMKIIDQAKDICLNPAGTIKKLKDAGIHTLNDLINCDAKVKAKEIQRVGEQSLIKWKQEARKLLNK